MRKLIQGIVDFRQRLLSEYIEKYSHLDQGQAPDYLLLTCSDSRVAPDMFASTSPGDVFLVRNVGNIISKYGDGNFFSEGAAIDFALNYLPVKEIIVCGHSDCGAMRAIIDGVHTIPYRYLQQWLRASGCSREMLDVSWLKVHPDRAHYHLAQLNVLVQLLRLKEYPVVQRRLQEGTLGIHGWYFDVASGSVYHYEEACCAFVLIDEREADRILRTLH